MNLLAVSHGCAAGWLSPFIPYFKSSDSHLSSGPVTPEDISWIGSLLCIGGFFGTIAFGTITEKFGKRVALFLLVIPHLSFWCLVFFSTHAYHLYLARFLAGITGGGALRTISLFITEIAENNIRGVLGSFYIFGLSSGMLLVFVIGTYVNYFVVPLIILAIPATFLVSLCFLHDTPVSLLERNKIDKAFESLKFYRTFDDSKVAMSTINAEFEVLKTSLKNKNEEKLELRDFCELT